MCKYSNNKKRVQRHFIRKKKCGTLEREEKERMGTAQMGRRKKTEGAGEELARVIMEKYHPKTAKEAEEAIKDIFGPIFNAMLQGEMEEHLGYTSNDHGEKETENRRNGYIEKRVRTSYGEVPVSVPRDRDASFEPQVIPKRSRDVSGIEDKVLSMYARGMSERDIGKTIEEIYGFRLSAESISKITDRVLTEVNEWQNRPLKEFYSFLFVDCLYVSIKRESGTKNCAVYVIMGYDINGEKDILGLWIGESEGKHRWMQIFDELKCRGVKDVLFICMDGVSGLEEGAQSIFKDVVVQRCIVHMIRNSIKYIPTKEYKRFAAQLRKVYGAASLKAAEAEFERFKSEWSGYPGAVDVWVRNWQHVAQLFNYGSAVRKVMYTTNAMESVNSSLRKVTKKGSFPNDDAVMKALYLRIRELLDKWKGRPAPNWAMVRNQLAMHDDIQRRVLKYEKY